MTSAIKPLSVRAYARSRRERGLPGGALRAVQLAIEGGRLVGCLARGPAGEILRPPKIADPDLADSEWDRNTHALKRTHGGGAPDHATDNKAIIVPKSASANPKKSARETPRPSSAVKGDGIPGGGGQGGGPGIPTASEAGAGTKEAPPGPGESGGAETAHEDERGTLADAQRDEKVWKAKIARLEYEKRAGNLVDASEVLSEWTAIISICRTRLLAVPARAKLRLPHLTPEDVATLEELVRESLEALAGEGATGESVNGELESQTEEIEPEVDSCEASQNFALTP